MKTNFRIKTTWMNKKLVIIILLLSPWLAKCQPKVDDGTKPGMRLVWQDEFDYKGYPDESKWAYEVGFVRNNEPQYYTENPCETVCPVAATTHSEEGINDMIYNRCVGTRYCANNCPYKVRRFNWFDYIKDVRKPMQMAMNPEVTVRSRGVMEKCSFCRPRIQEAKEKSIREQRALQDGDVVTACQQSCPANAIVFGDMNDPNSQVSQMFKKKNSYGLLEELNTVPALRYQTKIRNTNTLKADKHNGADQGGH